MEKANLGLIFAYLYKISAIFAEKKLLKLFTAKVAIFSKKVIASKIMMVISPFGMVLGVVECVK